MHCNNGKLIAFVFEGCEKRSAGKFGNKIAFHKTFCNFFFSVNSSIRTDQSVLAYINMSLLKMARNDLGTLLKCSRWVPLKCSFWLFTVLLNKAGIAP